MWISRYGSSVRVGQYDFIRTNKTPRNAPTTGSPPLHPHESTEEDQVQGEGPRRGGGGAGGTGSRPSSLPSDGSVPYLLGPPMSRGLLYYCTQYCTLVVLVARGPGGGAVPSPDVPRWRSPALTSPVPGPTTHFDDGTRTRVRPEKGRVWEPNE